LKASDGGTHPTSERRPSRFPRRRDREISRPRDDLGAESTLVADSAHPHHRDRSGGVAAPSGQFPRSMPFAIGSESCGRRHNREDRRRVSPELRPRTDGLRRQNSYAPSCGHGCRTPCRSAASPPPSWPLDSTPMSLRRDCQLQRLVRRRLGHQAACPRLDLLRRRISSKVLPTPKTQDVAPTKRTPQAMLQRGCCGFGGTSHEGSDIRTAGVMQRAA